MTVGTFDEGFRSRYKYASPEMGPDAPLPPPLPYDGELVHAHGASTSRHARGGIVSSASRSSASVENTIDGARQSSCPRFQRDETVPPCKKDLSL